MKKLEVYKKNNTKFTFSILIIMYFTLELSACNTPSEPVITGYVEGRYTYITTLFSGTLKTIPVSAGMSIKKNQTLFTLEPLPTQENLTIAQAKVQEAHNEIIKAEDRYQLQKLNYNRNTILLNKDIISKEVFENSAMEYQQSQINKKVALARLVSLQAEEKKAAWEMSQKKVTSPKDAVVFDTYYTVGENIQSGSPVLSLLDPTQVKIIFFIPESLYGKINKNQLIHINYDGAEAPVEARITYISDKASYNPPIIYSIDERARLVFRVEATPNLKVALKIHPGQPVTVSLASQED